MALVIHLTWILIMALRYAGIVVVYGGVVLFGVYFIGGNARSKNNAVPRSAWLGAGPRKGMKIVGLGLLMMLCAWGIQQFMPDGS